MREQKDNSIQERRERFEELYIRTYQKLYDYIHLMKLDHNEEKELLILTYVELYSNLEEFSGGKNVVEWLQNRADDVAKKSMGITQEQILSSRMADNRGRKNGSETPEEKRTENDNQISTFLEIEDYLKLDDNGDLNGKYSKTKTLFLNVFAIVLLIAAVWVIVAGADKVKEQIELVKKPFLESMSLEEESRLEAQKNQKKHVKIGNKIVYLSEIGQVLYSVPLEQTEWASEGPENPEIQVSSDGWVYYLPCPEREDSILANVSPDFFHTLYRMKDSKGEIEIVAREVEDFCLLEERIYTESFERIQVIEGNEEFEKMIPGIYVYVENGEIYLRDMLGRDVKKEADGTIEYEDRILQMDQDRIISVTQKEQRRDNAVYQLRELENSKKGIYRITEGMEEIFVQEKLDIDSFCIAGDWLYYSVLIRTGGSGTHYSKIMRKSLVEDKKPEQVHREFKGRIMDMYYCEENEHIYGNYLPKSWKSNYGVISVITPDGRMSYLDDEELRQVKETTGNDRLEFIMMLDNQVYCYWKDYQWERDKKPALLWKDVIVIPDGSRIRMKD